MSGLNDAARRVLACITIDETPFHDRFIVEQDGAVEAIEALVAALSAADQEAHA